MLCANSINDTSHSNIFWIKFKPQNIIFSIKVKDKTTVDDKIYGSPYCSPNGTVSVMDRKTRKHEL